ncbi:MAG: T9SS type A sorting domain-containing protein, partial [Chitinophagaceae bacterium]|nr:T9SS type A sorting domain-containing protein [Chitinophagaceae bacterium]
VWTPGSYIAGTSDDWGATNTDPFCGASVAGNGRLDTGVQKAAFNAYGAAFFRMHVGGDTSFAPLLRVEDIYPPTSSRLDTTQVYVSYHPGIGQRKDINRIDTATNITTNTIAGAVVQSGLTSSLICGGGLTVPLCGISTAQAKEPHRGTSSLKGLAQMSMRWRDTNAYYQNEIPVADQNTTMFKSLSFRVAQNYKDTKPSGADLDYTVELEDATGKIATKKVSEYSGALFFQPGTRTNILPKTVFNTVKIPLIDFVGIDQTKIKYIRFRYNAADSGAVLVSDIALMDNVLPCGIVKVLFKDSLGKAYDVFFKDSTLKNAQDSLVWLWKFGDPASGLADTSSMQHPKHSYTTAGAYTACLYVWAYRSTGMVCKDTFCKTITLLPNSISEQHMRHIVLSPNPANNYLNIYGTIPGDELELQNLYGQRLLQEKIVNNQIVIPAFLPNGIYIATIITPQGRSQQKLMIVR